MRSLIPEFRVDLYDEYYFNWFIFPHRQRQIKLINAFYFQVVNVAFLFW